MTKGRFTLHWKCCEDSGKCRRRFKLFVRLLVDLLDSLKQGKTGNWILMTQMLAPANRAWVFWLCWLCWCSGNYTFNTREFLYYLDELCGNELVFTFSFVSSNNTDVETKKKFILLHTRYMYVCDCSDLTNFSQKLWNLKKTCKSYFVRFRFSCFWPTMNSLMPSKERSFALRLFAYFKG